jgi:hypothetical protein
MKENLNCLDHFTRDVITMYMNTTDYHSLPSENHFNIPAMFGDDFAYTDAASTFKYINKLGELLQKHSKERYGV